MLTSSEKVSKVSNLRTITALTQPIPDPLQQEMRQVKMVITNPLAVNLTLLPMLAPPNYDEYANAIVEEGVLVTLVCVQPSYTKELCCYRKYVVYQWTFVTLPWSFLLVIVRVI